MSIWNAYPNLSKTELRALVAATARVLLESENAADVDPELLQQSLPTSARDLEPLLVQVDSDITRQKVRNALENEDLAIRMCHAVLDQVRQFPELADRVALEYDARTQKMVVVETVLLAGALVILAIKVKSIKLGNVEIVFDKAGEEVKTFVAGLAKIAAGGA